MGLTYIDGQIRGDNGKPSQNVRFLVDSGAWYTLLPRSVWQLLNLKPKRRESFSWADGTRVERDISEAHITLPQGEAHTPVVLGEADDEALLGGL